MGTVRYIGSKSRIAAAILDLVGSPSPQHGVFLDLFAGTGTVSREAALRGWRVRANDHLHSSMAVTTAQLVAEPDVPFASFGCYLSALMELNRVLGRKGFIYREYTPSGMSRTGHKRRYFTTENGARIDGIRSRIREWSVHGRITEVEQRLLIADLLLAANSVANIAGTYGCFLRHWTSTSTHPITLSPRTLLPFRCKFEVSTKDAFEVRANPDDVMYLDPPYTKRQYAAYYHVLETITAGDAPIVGGVTGLRPWEEKSSMFCYKREALKAMRTLIERIKAFRILISYSSEGHIHRKELEDMGSAFGRVRVHPVGTIGRYRPNKTAQENGNEVSEYVIEIIRLNTRAAAVG
ncbi:MAG TPA: DNA adenine methylase [Candidatus Dormibacteraeota bacterium]|nr:DNA adenine methylase [Candidatus Dormibacteraeota bacterium]